MITNAHKNKKYNFGKICCFVSLKGSKPAWKGFDGRINALYNYIY